MNRLAYRLGLWSSGLAALALLIFTACFIVIVLRPPLFLWTDLPSFLAYRREHGQFFVLLAQSCCVALGPLYVIMLNSLLESAAAEQRVLARLALALGIVFATLTGIHYFMQISAVRWNIEQGTTQEIEHFLQARPYSMISAVNMLGWTLFLGLSSLFAAPLFTGNRLRTAIRRLFWANGVFCLLAGVGYVFDLVVLLFVTINLGMGGALTAIFCLIWLDYRRQGRHAPHALAGSDGCDMAFQKAD